MRGSGSTGSYREASHPCTPLEGSHWRHSKVRRKERTNQHEQACAPHTGHRFSPAAVLTYSLHSLTPAKPKGVGGLKRGCPSPFLTAFLVQATKNVCLLAFHLGRGKNSPFCDTTESDLWPYSMAVVLSDECLMS